MTGYLGVVPDVGRSSHVAELRLVVSRDHRRRGTGRALARHGVLSAVDNGLTKVVVHVGAAQESTLAMFGGLGFEAEALLRDQVQDAEGQLHDVITMSHFVQETFDAIRASGAADVATDSR